MTKQDSLNSCATLQKCGTTNNLRLCVKIVFLNTEKSYFSLTNLSRIVNPTIYLYLITLFFGLYSIFNKV